MLALLAAGAMVAGTMVGESRSGNRRRIRFWRVPGWGSRGCGEGPKDNPISADDVPATFYQSLGIDPHKEFQTPTLPARQSELSEVRMLCAGS